MRVIQQRSLWFAVNQKWVAMIPAHATVARNIKNAAATNKGNSHFKVRWEIFKKTSSLCLVIPARFWQESLFLPYPQMDTRHRPRV
jgi:hypothetical protein